MTLDKSIFKGLLPDNPVILDVGCYDGKDGLELHELYGGELHAFDPVDNFKGHDLPNVRFYKLALSEINGLSLIHTSPNHPQSNSLFVPTGHKKVWPDYKFDPATTVVEVARLDNIWPPEKRIDLIWADLNGSEADFIDGAAQTLHNTRYLYIEVAIKELFKGQKMKDEILNMLTGWEVIGEYNFGENFGNLLLKNTNLTK